MNPRVFGVALFEHFRQLMDPRDPTSKDHLRILTGAFRLAVMRDSLFAALSGRILQANDEDLELYWRKFSLIGSQFLCVMTITIAEILNQRSTSFTEPLNMCLKEMKFKEVTRQQLFSTPWENQSASNMFGKMVMEARMIAKLVSGRKGFLLLCQNFLFNLNYAQPLQRKGPESTFRTLEIMSGRMWMLL